MVMSPLQNAGFFLVKVLSNTFLTIVILRLFLQIIRADFYNPISQFIVKLSNPLLMPLRKIIPGFLGLDMASIFLLFILQALELITLLLIKGIPFLSNDLLILGLLIWGVGELLNLIINIYFYCTIILVILSWISQQGYNPLLTLLAQMINPLLRPIKKYIKPIGGIDLSPWIFLIVLQLSIILIIEPLIEYGIRLSLAL